MKNGMCYLFFYLLWTEIEFPKKSEFNYLAYVSREDDAAVRSYFL